MSVNFNPATTFPVGLTPNSIIIADFNNDNNLDIVTGGTTFQFGLFSPIGGLSTLLGNGSGSFGNAISSEGSQFGSANSIAAGDFNKDNKLDVITTGNSSGGTASNVIVALGDGQGKFTAVTNRVIGSDPQSVVVGDVNGDTQLDAVLTDASSKTISILIGNGTGGFTSVNPVTLDNSPQAVALGDFNGDTKLDIAALTTTPSSSFEETATVSLLIGNGAGAFAAPTTSIDLGEVFPWDSFDIATADFNGDGKLDIASSSGGKISVLLSDPTQGLRLVFQTDQDASSIEAGDFNGDSRLDLATTATTDNGTNAATILLGNGKGGFSRPVAFTTGGSWNAGALASGDFNQDKKLDLARANSSFTDASVLLNNTTQTDAIAQGTTTKDNKQIGFIDASSELSGALTVDLAKNQFELKGNPTFKPALQGVDEIIGTEQDDEIRGNKRDNFLDGFAGKDELNGLNGNDRLIGGANDDELTGGKGQDRFIFSSTSNYPEGLEARFNKKLLGVDRIFDFEAGKDKIVLDAGTFTVLEAGKKVRFDTVDNLTEAKSSGATITYIRGLGQLYYNQNGTKSGLGSGGLFADLENEAALGKKDFVVFA